MRHLCPITSNKFILDAIVNHLVVRLKFPMSMTLISTRDQNIFDFRINSHTIFIVTRTKTRASAVVSPPAHLRALRISIRAPAIVRATNECVTTIETITNTTGKYSCLTHKPKYYKWHLFFFRQNSWFFLQFAYLSSLHVHSAHSSIHTFSGHAHMLSVYSVTHRRMHLSFFMWEQKKKRKKKTRKKKNKDINIMKCVYATDHICHFYFHTTMFMCSIIQTYNVCGHVSNERARVRVRAFSREPIQFILMDCYMLF